MNKEQLKKIIKEEVSAFYVTPEEALKVKPLQEMKYLVKIEDIGNVVMDASSEGEVKMKLSKKLKGGVKSIQSISRIQKSKADMAAKKLGVEGGDIQEGKPSDVKTRLGNKHTREINSSISKIQKTIGQLQKDGQGGDHGALLKLANANRILKDLVNKL